MSPTSLSGAELDALVALRRDLHAHPELRFEESRTADIVAAHLLAIGLEVHRGLGGTGVVGTIRGEGQPAIILRAELDALPIAEASAVPHASRYPGRTHACGHDGHMAMLLGAAAVLARAPKPPGSIHFVFQPGEEGGAGALRMIEDGLLDLFPAAACYGLHGWPGLPRGHFGICAGPIMAAGTRFTIRIEGRGAHAAQPHLAVDPIAIGCALIGQLQTLVSRRTDPAKGAVVSVCMFHAGDSDNVLPSAAEIRGTIRALDHDVFERLKADMTTMAHGVSSAHGASCDVAFHGAYPLTVNSPEETELARGVMRGLVGDAAIQYPTPANMTSEDFGFMLERKPGAYALIGLAEPGHVSPALHNPTFDFNDAVLPLGIAYWTAIARHGFDRLAGGGERSRPSSALDA